MSWSSFYIATELDAIVVSMKLSCRQQFTILSLRYSTISSMNNFVYINVLLTAFHCFYVLVT